MQRTPSESYDHIREAIVGYLETAYKISNPQVYNERGRILRKRGVTAQAPFVESTPSFPTSRKLAELERAYPQIGQGIAELVQHGVPVDRFKLWTHQEKALLASFSDQPNLLVATGTGSGKTETFLLPILSDILNESASWTAPSSAPFPGEYDKTHETWLHSRRHETRPAALRAIILYPMNALVNDQLSRLRRILARDASPDWQRRNLNDNVIHFGMYTSLTPRAGSWVDDWRREEVDEYLQSIRDDWAKLSLELQRTGSWARPDSPEMLVRWDIQQAPPDILVTNYSMLEYMLVRPIEAPIFETTRRWLLENENARLTLVLDEAHTYTGALGTEVAHLVRRLKERLGLDSGSKKFRAIATTASLPNGKDAAVKTFIAGLFGEPDTRFTLIKLEGIIPADPNRIPSEKNLKAFAEFHTNFTHNNPLPAIEKLATDLNLGVVDHGVDPQIALYQLLESQPDLIWIRQRTARNAILIDQLSDQAWHDLGTSEERERATAGILAAGSYARAEAQSDTPPLISMRLHGFFRGVPGVWACMNPNCSEVEPEHKSGARPIGRIYTDPRPWCECGSRVLEVFTCRHCGLLFLGGVPDGHTKSLWHWSDDLSGEQLNLNDFRIFGVELPHSHYPAEYRSILTTLPVHPNEPYARPVYEIEPAKDKNGALLSPYPSQCPRCSNYRSFAPGGREVIEPLRTKGPRAFAAVVEDAYRVQPSVDAKNLPNQGRKALLFSDSRPEAAQLAADLRQLHHSDLFRQLLYRALHTCGTCKGKGFVEEQTPFVIGQEPHIEQVPCPDCNSTGRAIQPVPLNFAEMQDRVLELQFERGINPTNTRVKVFFDRFNSGDTGVYEDAKWAFIVSLRREISENEFGLEPLGLASWVVPLPNAKGALAPLTEAETVSLIRVIARILATEDILLPPKPHNPWGWPDDDEGKPLVPEYERLMMLPGSAKQDRIVPYNLERFRKLGRYVSAVADALVMDRRLAPNSQEQWKKQIYWPLWNTLGPRGLAVMDYAGRKINDQPPLGIRVDRFELHPIGDTIEQCQACGYVMSEALLHICARCGQSTLPTAADMLHSFYRKSALYAIPGSGYDDPYPLRAIEHTAQISLPEARNSERWFQDLFRDGQLPEDYRIDVLSVTTTMEMGIDIGSLLTVALRNVPPTVPNYQQRAGRAGRRGSSIATVLTYAQSRSHDQYYFGNPPEIVSEPPRVPTLYLQNEVIVQRHIRSLILQDYFSRLPQTKTKGKGLFRAWGTVEEFTTQNKANEIQRYLTNNRAALIQRGQKVVEQIFAPRLEQWIDSLVGELQDAVGNVTQPNADLLEILIKSGLLPGYAFPVDVVGLSLADDNQPWRNDDERKNDDRMQRELKIALAEYAPGAEVIRGSSQDTYIYRVAGVYDPFEKVPNYRPTGKLFECKDCQTIDLLSVGASLPKRCPECNGVNVTELPYLRPRGFTVDQAIPDGGKKRYELGGRERAGFVSPARLLVGESSFTAGTAHPPYARELYSQVRVGQLFIANKGIDRDYPGFLICPDCGRYFASPDDFAQHKYPANVPPHQGKQKGPRAGQTCPNRARPNNQVILGHDFFSEVILLGADLPDEMDAPFQQPAGKAVWYSFGTLLKNAATVVLQVNPEELAVGVRPVKRGGERVHGEVFLYDDVPGGAGYARAIEANLEEILLKALELGRSCQNPDCSGACYHCMFDYRNQHLHPFLDRFLGTAILEYLLEGKMPNIDEAEIPEIVKPLIAFAQSGSGWTVEPAMQLGGRSFAAILKNRQGERFGIHVIHPATARPSKAEAQAILASAGITSATHTTFDLKQRPFWVMNNLVVG